jgi:anhydro-N-acetylmuramic acid kinase
MPNNTAAIGIMSGTSVDAIDAVLLEVTNHTKPSLISGCSRPFPGDLRQKIMRLSAPGENEIEQAGSVHTELGELYADIANSLKQEFKDTRITVIGCHGQTVRHRPNQEHAFTLQLGNGAVIAQRTGIDTVTDFRSADMALGGQGAPFAPFFHSTVFSSPGQTRAIVNLGGIANVTVLPGAKDAAVIGFDTGPANGLMDCWIQKHRGHQYDQDGAWGKSGTLNNLLLEQCLSEPYFELPPPKSTGRELFNLDWIEHQLDQVGGSISPVDVQRTLAELTAHSLADQLPQDLDVLYACGGGARNGWLMALIQDQVTIPVMSTEALGFAPQWIEAAAFAWMAAATINKKPCTIPSVTGASGSSIAGAVYYA